MLALVIAGLMVVLAMFVGSAILIPQATLISLESAAEWRRWNWNPARKVWSAGVVALKLTWLAVAIVGLLGSAWIEGLLVQALLVVLGAR